MPLTDVSKIGPGGIHLTDALPKALIELQSLTISGPLTGTTANTAIAVTDGIDVQDTLLKALQVVTSTGVWSALTVAPTLVKASGTLTLSGVIVGDVVAVNGKNYMAIATGINPTQDVPPFQFEVGASDTITASQLVLAINAEDLAVVASSAAAVVTITAAVGGTGGNAITLVVTGSNGHVTRSAATLASGATTAAVVSITSLFASGTLTLASTVAGATAVVNGKTYTFATLTVSPSTNLAPGVVPVGATDTASAANLAAAINNDPLLSATASGAVVTVKAQAEGTGGNAITIVGSGTITASGANLAGGSATNSVKITSDTTGAQVFLYWFKKSRNLLQL